VTPFIEGESLRHRLDRQRRLTVSEALRFTSEIGDALAYAHERGVVHRDIKPENILLDRDHAVVADFGIARALATAGSERMTATGTSLGTPHYMSPEQAFGEDGVDARSDLYSLACVLYEMLAGEAPFTGQTVLAIVMRHLKDRTRRTNTSGTDSPKRSSTPWLASMASRSLRVRPHSRSRERLSTCGTSPAPSVSPTSSRAACAGRVSGSASQRSSSQRPTARRCGRSGSTVR